MNFLSFTIEYFIPIFLQIFLDVRSELSITTFFFPAVFLITFSERWLCSIGWPRGKYGYDKEVDQYRDIINTSKDWLSNYQKKLIEETWISKLKIKYTNVSGYFIEISKIHLDKVPNNFVHKQTLVNAARFITSELKEFEEQLLQSEAVLAEKEYALFLDVRERVLSHFADIKKLWQEVAFLDFWSSLASVAYQNNYHRPKLHSKYDLSIEAGRHPVIEQIEKEFISNSLQLGGKDYVHIITWPNMGWKSTFLRQNALLLLMSHMWSFIPAGAAKIPLTDKIFSRVWATDNLYFWQSTFMVEMQEIANILHNSTEKSFVIIDEIGRWTSTYDGMSLAWSILRHNHDKIKSKTLFATHYHELIDESKNLKWVSNYSVAVGENDENLVFLRKIIPWGMKKSYGIHVAQIAGLSNDIIVEAREMLMRLEWQATQMSLIDASFVKSNVSELKVESELEKKIKKVNLNTITPIEAINLLNELQNDC